MFTCRQIDKIPQLASLSPSQVTSMKAVSAVLPFRVNNYVLDELIDWSNIPDDPIYQLTFPQPGMLRREDFERMFALVRSGATEEEIQSAAREIQQMLNPHPAGHMELNVPARRRRAHLRAAAQVRRNRTFLSGGGPDLPRLLHALLPLGTVRRDRRAQVRGPAGRLAGALPPRAP